MMVIKLNSQRLRRRETTRRNRGCPPHPWSSKWGAKVVSTKSAIANKANNPDQAWIQAIRACLNPKYHLASRKPS